MGVCGYTYDQVSAMPIAALAKSIAARNRFANAILRAFMGAPDSDQPDEAVSTRPVTPALVKALFGVGK